MNDSGYIQIRISGSKDGERLTPHNFDISELLSILGNVEQLLGKNRKGISHMR